VACLLKARIVKPAETAVAKVGSIKTPVARQWPNSHHMIAATDTHATIEELLEAVFPVRSVPSLYNEDQLPLPVSRSKVESRES
jgi:hypothetical protein